MLSSIQPVRPARARGFAAAAAALCAAGLLAAAPAAHAALGGGPMTTPDGAKLSSAPASAGASASATMRNAITTDMSSASSASTPAAAAPFTVRQTTLGTGTLVREYLTPGGVVFGVAWQGPFLPSLADIFGDAYYQQYVAGAQTARAARGGIARGPMVVDQGGLVVHSGGHPGGFVGNAYVPALLPAGVSPADIQ